jgi:tRNA nucleotidyltransferase/poly(A) polymerase
LARRDFTINALAMKRVDSKIEIKEDLKKFIVTLPNPSQEGNDNWVILDLFGGVKDLDKKIIRAVGEPYDRFKEDSLRMMRAQISAQVGFKD